jgi:hypothetical protein
MGPSRPIYRPRWNANLGSDDFLLAADIGLDSPRQLYGPSSVQFLNRLDFARLLLGGLGFYL